MNSDKDHVLERLERIKSMIKSEGWSTVHMAHEVNSLIKTVNTGQVTYDGYE